MAQVFIIDNMISRTGLSTLFRAHMAENDRGLMYIAKQYNFAENKAELLREMKISQQIYKESDKEIVIPIIRIEETPGGCYAIMALKENGCFLREILGEKQVTFSEAISLMKGILQSLVCLHSCFSEDSGVLHLDLHPGNIFFESYDRKNGAYGSVLFIDFGNAVHIENGLIPAHDTVRYMTQGYSAPEIIDKSLPPGYSSDVYSAGVIFAGMITGKSLKDPLYEFSGDYLKKAAAPGVPSVLTDTACRIIRCALETNGQYRYQTAQAMLDDLDSLQMLCDAVGKKDLAGMLLALRRFGTGNPAVSFSDTGLSVDVLETAIEALYRSLSGSNIDYKTAGYLFDFYRRAAEDDETAAVSEECRSHLLSCGLAVTNFFQDPSRGIRLYEEWAHSGGSMNLPDYLNMMNRLAQAYAYRMDYQTAYEYVSRNIGLYQRIRACYSEISREIHLGEQRITGLGRSYSARARYGAVLGIGDAAKDFARALYEFQDDTPNTDITVNHILNYAADIRDRKLYEKYCDVKLSDLNNLPRVLRESFDSVRQDGDYAFRTNAYLKGVYAFYPEYLSGDAIDFLTEILKDDSYNVFGSSIAFLIILNIGRILLAHDKNEETAFLALYRAEKLNNGLKISGYRAVTADMLVRYRAEWDFNCILGKSDRNEILLEKCAAHLYRSRAADLADRIAASGSLSAVLVGEYN